jgi:membrane fusion protein, multidrug efflux system
VSRIASWIIGLSLVAAIGTVGYSLFAPASDTTGAANRTAATGSKGKGSGQGRGQGKGQSRDAVPVFAAIVATADVPVIIEGLGAARGLNTVTVQPLVDGRLLSVNFKEGQNVQRGDLLATIDPAIYSAQLKQAEAKKAQDDAQLTDARRELERNSSVGPIATLQKNVDTSRAKVAQFEALVKADEAAIDLARTQLGYTSVVAPISGRTGFRLVDEGNIVRASSNSAIVVITEVQPIAVFFNLPQQQLARINSAIATNLSASGPGTKESTPNTGLRVDAISADGLTVLDRGSLRVVDNQVDQTTGTIRLKAEFPNANLQLWPGQFTSIRMQIDNLAKVVVVPAAAVQQGPTGSFVYVVTPDDRVKMRPVKVTLQDERRAAIAEGLTPGEKVVTSSFSRLRDDTAVTVTPAPEPSASSHTIAPIVPATATPETRGEGPRSGSGKQGRRREAGTGQGTTGPGTAPGTPGQ